MYSKLLKAFSSFVFLRIYHFQKLIIQYSYLFNKKILVNSDIEFKEHVLLLQKTHRYRTSYLNKWFKVTILTFSSVQLVQISKIYQLALISQRQDNWVI
jgi:hypothetical protein